MTMDIVGEDVPPVAESKGGVQRLLRHSLAAGVSVRKISPRFTAMTEHCCSDDELPRFA